MCDLRKACAAASPPLVAQLGHTPLQAAALNSRAHLVRLLIKDGRADSSLALPGPCPGRTLLHAVSDAQVLRDLLGAQRSDPRAVDCVGDSPLHAAIRRGGSEGVRATATLLADARVDINYANKVRGGKAHLEGLAGVSCRACNCRQARPLCTWLHSWGALLSWCLYSTTRMLTLFE